MDKYPTLLYKTLVVGVIVLFIGVSIQPVIATVQLEDRNVEYFYVTTEFVGLNKKHIKQLTNEEIQQLDSLFNLICDRVNNSKSYTETIEIFKEALIELDRYGLLGDVGIDATEKLVTNCFQKTILTKIFDNIFDNKIGTLDEDENRFCLIVGITVGLIFFNPVYWSLLALLMNFLQEFTDIGFYELGAIILFLTVIPSILIPVCLGRMIQVMHTGGMIVTCGLYGLKYWYGYLKGKIYHETFGEIAAVGFTGLKIEIISTKKQYFFGFARNVHIEDYWPTKEV